jgi:acyl carrier protein
MDIKKSGLILLGFISAGILFKVRNAKKKKIAMEIEEKVKDFIVNIKGKSGLKKSDVVSTSYLRNDLGMDSLDIEALIMAVDEEEWGVEFDEEAAKIERVGDLILYIEWIAKNKKGPRPAFLGSAKKFFLKK